MMKEYTELSDSEFTELSAKFELEGELFTHFFNQFDKQILNQILNSETGRLVLLRRNKDIFYSFIPLKSCGLTLLEHFIIQNKFEIVDIIYQHLQLINPNSLDQINKNILQHQINLYQFYQKMISNQYFISEFDVYHRTYSYFETFQNALKAKNKELMQKLCIAALPLNYFFLNHIFEILERKFTSSLINQDFNPWDILLMDTTQKTTSSADPGKPINEMLNKIFSSLNLSLIEIMQIVSNHPIVDILSKSSFFYSSTCKKTLKKLKFFYIQNHRIDKTIQIIHQISEREKVHLIRKYCSEALKIHNYFGLYNLLMDTKIVQYALQSLFINELIIFAGQIPYDRLVYEIMNNFLLHSKQLINFNLNTNHENKLIHFLVANNSLETLKFLLPYNLDINKKGEFEQTALHIAVKHNYISLSSFLISLGADINIRDSRGYTALHLAVKLGHMTIIELLLSKDLNIKMIPDMLNCYPIHYAVEKKNLTIMKILLQQSTSDIDKQNNFGNTPLHIASKEGDSDITNYLLKKGAKTNIVNKDGLTALNLAIKNGHHKIVKLFITHGTDHNLAAQIYIKDNPFILKQSTPYGLQKLHMYRLLLKYKVEDTNPQLKIIRQIKELPNDGKFILPEEFKDHQKEIDILSKILVPRLLYKNKPLELSNAKSEEAEYNNHLYIREKLMQIVQFLEINIDRMLDKDVTKFTKSVTKLLKEVITQDNKDKNFYENVALKIIAKKMALELRHKENDVKLLDDKTEEVAGKDNLTKRAGEGKLSR